MSLIVIKIVDKNDASGTALARGELEGAGFTIVYENDAEGVLVDANRSGGGEYTYGATWIIVGQKT